MGEAKPLTAFQQTYHWRNKNCGPWSHQWVKENLPGLKVEEGQVSAEIKEVSSVSGDCDLGQRKGKLLTIYDLDIEAKWVGTDSEGEEVLGRVHIPEFSHEVVDGLSDYNLTCQFIIELSSTSTPSADALLRTVRASLPAQLKGKFDTFRPTLLEAHGIFTEGSPAPSGSSTPARYAPAPPGEVRSSTPNQAAASSSAPAKPKAALGNTKTVEASAQLQVSADDLWSLLTDEARVPMWSRSAAKVELKPEGAYELFGGNVRGTIKEVDAPKRLVQTWQTRNGTWPADHFGTLTTKLDQGSDSTTLTLTLEGVPSGQEGDLERALNTFYIQGLKQMGLVLSSTSRTYSSPLARAAAPSIGGNSSTSSTGGTQKPKKRRLKAGRTGIASGAGWFGSASTGQVLGAGAIIGLGAVFVGLVVHSVQSAGKGT